MNRDAKVAIISTDKDHQSVIDYWHPRLATPSQLVRAKTIANAIKVVSGEEVRKQILNDRTKTLDLQAEFARHEERKRLVKTISVALSDTEYEKVVLQIAAMVIAADRPKILYLNSIKSFGRKAGTEVYRKINGCVGGEDVNKYLIDEAMIKVAYKFKVEPKKLLSHVLEYKLVWKED